MKVQLTQYGYANDPYGDTLTREGWGSFGNKIAAQSCALKRSTAKAIGAIPRCKLLLTAPGFSMIRFWDDVVPEFDPGARCDLYEPEGMVKGLPEFVTVSVVKDEGFSAVLPV